VIYRTSILAIFFLFIVSVTNTQTSADKLDPEEIQILRGPYLQSGTTSSIIIKWQTSKPVSSRVLYGTHSNHLNKIINDSAKIVDHEIRIEGLKKHTKYYYAVGTLEKMLIEDDPTYYFITSPDQKFHEVVHIWAIGDFGTGDREPKNVKDAYMKFRKRHHTDVWLMLGDIAYYFGKDEEFQRSIFGDTYKYMMRHTVIWPTPGNHDMRSADSETESGPYYNIFTVPTRGEAGGEPSGTEAYYSFNYGDIHFISMDSEDTPRQIFGDMARWLERDLQMDDHKWKIAYFHHPPYTKGTHNSDKDMDSRGRMKDMRENFLPKLEEYGVDLVLSGHSHIYERSYLLKGHYGYSHDFDPDTMIIQYDNEKKKNKSAFFKKEDNYGTVYIVCGVSGSRPVVGTCDHPAMAVCKGYCHGSMSIEIRDNLLLGVFVDELGKTKDSFTITKEFNKRAN
jgi:hypothetical protein